MATTAQQIFEWTMDLLDERLDSGSIDVSATKSYNVKTPGLLTLLQHELIEQGGIYSTYEIANKPAVNLLGYAGEFNIISFEGAEFIREAVGSARAYYFEVDRVGTVYVEDYNGAWNTLATVETTNIPNGFTAYKGIVEPSIGATKSRLRFTGSYYYRTLNRALFAIPFASAVDVPAYREWVKHTMPNDFKSVDEIISEEKRNYTKDAGFKWEGRRDLYINYYFDGNLRIVYRPVPAIITTLTDTMQVDDVTARTVVPYGLAAHLLISENPDVASFYQQRFEEAKRDAKRQQPASFEQITNLYGGF